MRTPAARALHLGLFLTGVVLYVVFVLPRWWVLTGDIPSTLATAGRIAAGIPIAAAAWPVWQILQAALRGTPRTPEIALRLRAWSAVLHVVAGVLILLAAIAEIWLSLDAGGPYLFGVYGAAGAIAILAFLGLYLSFVAEKPPAGPKPPRAAKVKVQQPKPEKTPRGKKRAGKPAAPVEIPAEAEAVTEHETTAVAEADTILVVESSEAVDETPDTTTVVVTEDSAAPAATPESTTGPLRNKRPAGKSRRRPGR